MLWASSLGEKTLAVVSATVLMGEFNGMDMTVSPDDNRQPATAMPAMDNPKIMVLRSCTPRLDLDRYREAGLWARRSGCSV